MSTGVHFSGSALTNLIAIYGYWAVLVFVFIESMGIPFPGETMLILASLYAGSTHHLNIVFVIVAAAAGAILGDNTGYLIGREGGYRLVRRYGHYIHLNERELKLGQYLFIRHGGKVVFFGRFVSVLRAWAAFLAGVNRMVWWKFFAFNAAGGILWAALYGTAAYVLGKNIHRFTGPVGIGIGVVAALIILGFLIYLHHNFSRLADEAEQALPGPLDQYRKHPEAAMNRAAREEDNDKPPSPADHRDTTNDDPDASDRHGDANSDPHERDESSRAGTAP